MFTACRECTGCGRIVVVGFIELYQVRFVNLWGLNGLQCYSIRHAKDCLWTVMETLVALT